MGEEALVARHALLLAEGMTRMLRDMRGLGYRLDGAAARVRRRGRPSDPFPLRVGIRFSGHLAGEYVLWLGRETAARMAGLWSGDQGLRALEDAREEAESLVKEILNSAVGAVIRDLERAAGSLDFEPATAEDRGSGDAAAPMGPAPAAWGEMLLLGETGPVLCGFLLDAREARGGAREGSHAG